MGTQTIGHRVLSEYLPENVVRISVATQAQSNDVPAYLVLKLIQAFECSTLLLSRRMKSKLAAVDREMAGNQSEENLFFENLSELNTNLVGRRYSRCYLLSLVIVGLEFARTATCDGGGVCGREVGAGLGASGGFFWMVFEIAGAVE
jgi:hypothetical protein